MNKIFGIDLGTSTSEISYIDKNGKVTLIPNEQGDFVTPSVILIDKEDNIIIGHEAKEKSLLFPDNTIIEVKRLIGSGKKLKVNEKEYTPSEMSSYILKYLATYAENFVGTKVKDVVITVPAYFNQMQREETMEAGRLAGLDVKRIINEPTAAALDYGLSHMEYCKNIMVYDLGGGTLDVTVLELFEGIVDVKASAGNNGLGGKDFDEKIIKHITQCIELENNFDITSDTRAMFRIKTEAERCKIALSTEDKYEIQLPFLSSKDGQPLGYTETITKNFFEKLIEPLISSSMVQINEAVKESHIEISQLDMIILVGGSTKIPFVKNFLKEKLKLDIVSHVDPDLAVVRGASIQGGIISGAFDENGPVIMDVCPFSLSTKVYDPNKDESFCDILIKKNSPIPTDATKKYMPSSMFQTEARVEVYQGESRDADENILLNTFLIDHIPTSFGSEPENIEVTFKYDINAILCVSAEVVSIGKKVTITIDTKAGDTLDSWQSAKGASKYKSIIKRAEEILKNGNSEDFYNLEKQLKYFKYAIINKESKQILEDLKESIIGEINWLEEEE